MNLTYMMHMNEAGTGWGILELGIICVRGFAVVSIDRFYPGEEPVGLRAFSEHIFRV